MALVDVIGQQAGRLVQILNDSLRIANESKSLKTRIARLALARSTLAELQSLATQFPFISLTNLTEVLKSIDDVAAEIEVAAQQASSSPTPPRRTAKRSSGTELDGTGPLASLPLREVPLAVIDLETTGLSASSGARIVEVSIVRVDPGQEPRVVLDTLVNPQGPVYCTDIHGISDDDVVGAPTFPDIVGDTVSALGGALVGAFNASFDMGFLRAELGWAGHSRELRAPPPHVCLMWLRPLLGIGKRCSLDIACKEQGVSPGGHRAAGDAMAGALMWPRYVEAAEQRGIRTLGDLARAGSHKYLMSLRYPFYGAGDFSDAGGQRGVAALKPRAPSARPAFAGVRQYWHALVDALVDGVLAESELTSLRDMQTAMALSQEQIRSVHARVFADRLREAAEDDSLTDQELKALSSLRQELAAIGWAP